MMHTREETLQFALKKATEIKDAKTCTGLDATIAAFVRDGIPHGSISAVYTSLPKELEDLRYKGYADTADTCNEYLTKYPMMQGYGQIGSHVDADTAALNHSTIFIVSLIAVILLDFDTA